jgi:hypothetical protein
MSRAKWVTARASKEGWKKTKTKYKLKTIDAGCSYWLLLLENPDKLQWEIIPFLSVFSTPLSFQRYSNITVK